ncbi:MAG: CHAP domain-containing protein [Candidatus Berkelbacteria bacterium]|nr:MAG: CHAP domain-containing protein [Candidatus Berkelbacteria bacterium]QQG51965.1 MAG: CHAP domain-containing protein [Candidatus Berkelbacteria bacterium]
MPPRRGKRIFVKSVGFLALVITLLSAPLSAQAVSLNELLKRQREVEKQQQQNQQRLNQSRKVELTLQQTLNALTQDIASTQGRLDTTRRTLNIAKLEIERIDGEVEKTEKDIAKLDGSTRRLYILLYETLTTSKVIMLTSESIGEYTTRINYLESIQQQLMQDGQKLSALKQELLAKKASQVALQQQLEEVESLLSNDKAVLASQQQQQSLLLNLNQEQQDRYEDSLKKLATEHETLSQSIYEARRRQAGSENINQGATSAYPYADEPNPAAADPWLFIKRQCVSYTAWKWLVTYGQPFMNTRPGSGSGWNWPALARDQGYKTSSTPRVGAVVSWPIGENRPYGHTAWVEKVNSDGTINVSEYNWLVPRGYGERRNVNALLYGTPTYIYP